MLLLFTPLGITLNGSSAWLDVPGGTIQPGEFFKLWFVMFLASWLLRKRDVMDELQFFFWFLVLVGLVAILFLLIPDGGSFLVIWSVSLLMFWYAWWKSKYIGIMIILWLWLGALAATQFTYIERRLDYFVNPDSDTSWRGVGRQTRQALIAVWWGGWIGKWYGKWLQKFGYIPEAQSDFIFAAFSEEIGFIGNSILLTLYFLVSVLLSHQASYCEKWVL